MTEGTGQLPPRRPDQRGLDSPRGTTPGARINRLGGTPGSKAALGINQQTPTAFYTFQSAGRLFAAEITFAVSTNASYAASTQQFYARVTTLSGLALGSIQLSLSGPTQNANGQGGLTFPDTGVPVQAGDKLLLDVNNGAPVTGSQGTMRADCSVFFSLP